MTQEFKDQNALEVDGQLLCRHFLGGKCIKVCPMSPILYFFVQATSFLLFCLLYFFLTLHFSPSFPQGDNCQLKHVQGYNNLIKLCCKFYIQGFCLKGDSCPYMHDILPLFYRWVASYLCYPNLFKTFFQNFIDIFRCNITCTKQVSWFSFTLAHSPSPAGSSIEVLDAFKKQIAGFPTIHSTKPPASCWMRSSSLKVSSWKWCIKGALCL